MYTYIYIHIYIYINILYIYIYIINIYSLQRYLASTDHPIPSARTPPALRSRDSPAEASPAETCHDRRSPTTPSRSGPAPERFNSSLEVEWDFMGFHGGFMEFHSDSKGFNQQKIGMLVDTPSGKLTGRAVLGQLVFFCAFLYLWQIV